MHVQGLIVVLLLALALGCSRSGASTHATDAGHGEGHRQVVLDTDTVKRLGVTTLKVGEEGILSTISVPGTIEYDLLHYAEVGPRLDGRVVAVHVKLGDKVKLGDMLAEMAVPALGDAQAAALTTNAMLLAAQKNAAREKELLAKGLTTAREAEMADAELKKAQAEVAAADARLKALGVGTTTVGRSIRLVSPIDGVVVQRHAILGGFLAMSSNAFAIADTTKLMATLEVHEADLPYLSLGSKVVFTADGLPGRSFEGKLTFIDPFVSKSSRLVRARVEVPNEDGLLRPGMFVRAAIALPRVGAVGSVPLPPQSIQPLGADDVAFVEKSPGHYEIRKLKLGRRTSEVVEVLEGIARGETVVVEGAFLLRGEAAKQ